MKHIEKFYISSVGNSDPMNYTLSIANQVIGDGSDNPISGPKGITQEELQNIQQQQQQQQQQQIQRVQEDELMNFSSGANRGLSDENINSILAMVESNPDLMNDPEIAELVNSVSGDARNQFNEQNRNTQQRQNVAQSSVGGNQSNSMPNLDIFMNMGNPFFGENKVDYSAINENNIPQYSMAHAKSIGVDVNQKDWPSKYFEKLSSTPQSSFDEYKTKYESLKNELDSLPVPLAKALTSAINNQDWRSTLNNETVDFSVDWNKLPFYEKIDIAKKLNPNFVISQDQIKEDDPVAMSLLSLGEGQYNLKKQQQDSYVQEQIRLANQRKTEYQQSIQTTTNKLKEKFPNMGEPYIQMVQNVLGNLGVRSVFFNEGGTSLKEDAAVRLAYALFGDHLIQQETQKASSNASNQAVANIITQQQSAGFRPTPQQQQNVQNLGNSILEDASQILAASGYTY